MLIEEPIKNLEAEFSELFIRVHRNALVAKKEIDSIAGNGQEGFILSIKSSDDNIQVSRRRKPSVRRFIVEFKEAA